MPDARPTTDEQFGRLLDGLRVTLPGVEVLFAFLLVVPLQAGFGDLSDTERFLYAVALVTAAVALVLLIAPSVHQRVRTPVDGVARRHESHVRVAAYLGIAGSVAMSVSLVASTWLALSLAYASALAPIVAVLVAVLIGWAWFWLPVRVFRDDS